MRPAGAGRGPAPWRAARTVRSLVPWWCTRKRMPTSISVEPSTVKSTKRPAASARVSSGTWSSPKRRTSTHIGTRTTSKAMKKRMASRAMNVASAPDSTSRMQPRKVDPVPPFGVGPESACATTATGEQRREEHERGRDAVDAEVPPDAERADPRRVQTGRRTTVTTTSDSGGHGDGEGVADDQRSRLGRPPRPDTTRAVPATAGRSMAASARLPQAHPQDADGSTAARTQPGPGTGRRVCARSAPGTGPRVATTVPRT